MLKTIVVLLFISLASLSNSQAQAYTYYPFNSVFSVSTNPNKKLWADIRLQTNSYFTSLSTEIAPMLNCADIGTAKLYVGFGGRFNFLNYLNDDASKRKPFEAYFMSIGTRISPFKQAPQAQIVFELSPDLSKAIDLGQIRARLGIAYVFEKKKK